MLQTHNSYPKLRAGTALHHYSNVIKTEKRSVVTTLCYKPPLYHSVLVTLSPHSLGNAASWVNTTALFSFPLVPVQLESSYFQTPYTVP